MTAVLAPRPGSRHREDRSSPVTPSLRVLDQRPDRRRKRLRQFTFFLFGLVLGGLFLVAFVHARLVETQRELDQVNSQIVELRTEAEKIERAIEIESAPNNVVGRAEQLGMVPASSSSHLQAVRAVSNR